LAATITNTNHGFEKGNGAPSHRRLCVGVLIIDYPEGKKTGL